MLKIPDTILDRKDLDAGEKMLLAAIQQQAKFGEAVELDFSAPDVASAVTSLSAKCGDSLKLNIIDPRGHQVTLTLFVKATINKGIQEGFDFDDKEERIEAFKSDMPAPEFAGDTIIVGPQRFAEIKAAYAAAGLGKKRSRTAPAVITIDGRHYVTREISDEFCVLTECVDKLFIREGEKVQIEFSVNKTEKWVILEGAKSLRVQKGEIEEAIEGTTPEAENLTAEDGLYVLQGEIHRHPDGIRLDEVLHGRTYRLIWDGRTYQIIINPGPSSLAADTQDCDTEADALEAFRGWLTARMSPSEEGAA